MTLEQIIPWVLSAITIYMFLLAGNKKPYTWLIGLGNQALWLIWILISGTWGLLPMNIALWVVYARNHLKWREGAHDALNNGPDLAERDVANPKKGNNQDE